MGRKGPRAGMPLANIQSVLDDLIANGFSVVVCQQADESTNSSKIAFYFRNYYRFFTNTLTVWR